MVAEIQTTEAKVNKLLHDISVTFGLSCGFFDINGRQLGCCGFDGRSNFCRFVNFYDTKQICHQSYLRGFGDVALKKEPLVHFCPFGLINITFPVLRFGKEPLFVTSGPLLYQEPDDQMIANILDVNFLLRPRAREIRQYLSEIPVKSEGEVSSLVSVVINALNGAVLLPSKVIDAAVEETEDAEVLTAVQFWLNVNPDEENDAAFTFFIENLTPEFPEKEDDELSQKDFEKIIRAATRFVFAGETFRTQRYRAVKYLELLINLAHQSNFYLDHIFSPEGIDLEEIFSAQSSDELKALLLQVKSIYLNSYLAKKEVEKKDVLFRAMHYIRNHYQDISLSDVAEAVNLNPAYFSNFFKRSTGQSYSAYLNKIRIEESKRLLMTDCSLSEIAQRVGFSDQSYFTNVFKKSQGISPNRWRQEQGKRR